MEVPPDLSRYLLAFDAARRRRMSVMLDPVGALRDEIDEISSREDLDPQERLRELNALAAQLEDLLGSIGRYSGDLQLVQEAAGPAFQEAVMLLREDADIRRVLVERGLMTEAELDEQGILSHVDLDHLTEEGLLDLWVEESFLNIHFDPLKHPRGRGGKFSDVLGRVVKPKGRRGGSVPMPSAPHPSAAAPAPGRLTHDTKAVEPHLPSAPPAPAPHVPGSVHPDLVTTPSEVAADLDEVRRTPELQGGWVERGELARQLLGPTAEDTDQLYSTLVRGLGEDSVWDPEREKLHDKIVDTLLRERKPVHVTDSAGNPLYDSDGQPKIEMHPNPDGAYLTPAVGQPIALFMAGGTASGKSTALKLQENKDVVPVGAVHIDPDEIKAMLPEFNQLIAAKDKAAAAIVHEESSKLAKRLQREAMEKGLHVVVDGTGNSEPGKFAEKIQKAAKNQYEPHVFYVNAPTDTALSRAIERGQKTGRFVPESMIREVHRNVSNNVSQVQKLVEDGTIKSIRGYDTGADPTLMFSGGDGGYEIHDPALYERFLAKGVSTGV